VWRACYTRAAARPGVATVLASRAAGAAGLSPTAMPPTRSALAHALIAGTILFTVYGQLVIKWQVSQFDAGVRDDGARFLLAVLLNPWIVTGLASAFLAFLCWAGAVSRLPLSYAYPFTSLSFVLVALLSNSLFGEPLGPRRLVGLGVVILGLVIGSRG
jgi:drug/metabolite transporter (DMT)-like permease